MAAMIQHSAETMRKRQMLSRVWAAAVILWAVIRTAIIWAALGDYGFNPWIYLCIDLVCATTDAITTPRMVLYFIDDNYRLAIKWGVISLVAFVIPDIYIFVGTRTLPTRVIVVLCARDPCDDVPCRCQHRPQDSQGPRRAGTPRSSRSASRACLNCGHESSDPRREPHWQHLEGRRDDRRRSCSKPAGRSRRCREFASPTTQPFKLPTWCWSARGSMACSSWVKRRGRSARSPSCR